MPSRLLATIGAGYLLGSLPIAATVARRAGVDDLREVGDRNPGYWNAKELIGNRRAAPIFVGDTAKGALAAALGRLAGEPWWTPYASGGAAMVGHAFPIGSSRHGGKGVLTMVGTLTVAAPRPAAAAWATMAVTWAATRRFDTAARIGVAAFPLWQLVLEGPRRTAAAGALMTLVGARFAMARQPLTRATDDLAS